MFRPLTFIGIFCVQGLVFAGSGSFELSLIERSCESQRPRFPASFRNHKDLRAVPALRRQHRAVLEVKDARARLHVEAQLIEIDLDRDGTCDLIITVRDPLSSGGDSEVLSTVYLAQGGKWIRYGARSALKGDRPAELSLAKYPEDENYEFADFTALEQGEKTYIVAWRYERVLNGFDGYRILELDRRAGRLQPIDKWSSPGIEIYRFFKTLKVEGGSGLRFDTLVEAAELRSACASLSRATPTLKEVCKNFKE